MASYIGNNSSSSIVGGVGHLSLGGDGGRRSFYFCITDAESRYMVAKPLPDLEPKTVALAVHEHWFLRIPTAQFLVVAERNKHFCRSLKKELVALLEGDRRCGQIAIVQRRVYMTFYNRRGRVV